MSIASDLRVGGAGNLSACTKHLINLKDAVRRNTAQLCMCKPKGQPQPE